jgi:hypothetical protein
VPPPVTPSEALHLARRFVGSLRPGPPAAADERWATAQLSEGERGLWRRMTNPDRRHAVSVARLVAERWPVTDQAPPRPVLAAALLHDVGKVDAALRTPARVVATLLWAVLDDEVAERWAGLARRPGDPRVRLARYRRHPELGAELLREAGADELTVVWAEQHHRPEDRWTVPVDVGRVLKDCDDD